MLILVQPVSWLCKLVVVLVFRGYLNSSDLVSWLFYQLLASFLVGSHGGLISSASLTGGLHVGGIIRQWPHQQPLIAKSVHGLVLVASGALV